MLWCLEVPGGLEPVGDGLAGCLILPLDTLGSADDGFLFDVFDKFPTTVLPLRKYIRTRCALRQHCQEQSEEKCQYLHLWILLQFSFLGSIVSCMASNQFGQGLMVCLGEKCKDMVYNTFPGFFR